MSGNLKVVWALRQHHQRAAEQLMQTVIREFPIGAVVEVTINHSKVRGRVVGHSDSWWYEPDYVRIENVVTGKRRKFCAGTEHCDAVVVEEAKESEVTA